MREDNLWLVEESSLLRSRRWIFMSPKLDRSRYFLVLERRLELEWSLGECWRVKPLGSNLLFKQDLRKVIWLDVLVFLNVARPYFSTRLVKKGLGHEREMSLSFE